MSEVTFDFDKLKEQLIEDEGVIYQIYRDHLGYPTFGIGHLIVKEDPEYGQDIGTPVSEERVWEVFERDAKFYRGECMTLYGNKFIFWPQEVQQVLCNMMFNLGRTRLGQFNKMNQALEEKDWKTAATEGRDSRWYRQVTNRAERLMSRLEKVGG